MNQQINKIISETVGEVLKGMDLNDLNALVGHEKDHLARSKKAAQPSMAHESSYTSEFYARRNSSRQLANENIARWLGKSSEAAKVTIEKNTEKSKNQDSNASVERNLIPHPHNRELLNEILKVSPARIGVWRAGTRYLTKVVLKLRADHAVAKDAVYAELDKDFAKNNGWIPLETNTKSKEEFLLRPDLGRELSKESLQTVREKGVKNPDIQIIVADGLSAWAAERYAKPVVEELLRLFKEANLSVGTIFCVRYSRVAIQDVIGEAVGAKLSMILLGERPGLGSGDSLSNYMIYGPHVGAVNAKKSMISNIHPQGYQPVEAARITFSMVKKMFEQKCSGIELK